MKPIHMACQLGEWMMVLYVKRLGFWKLLDFCRAETLDIFTAHDMCFLTTLEVLNLCLCPRSQKG